MNEERNSGLIDLDALMEEAAELAWRERREALLYAPTPPTPPSRLRRSLPPLAGFVGGVAFATLSLALRAPPSANPARATLPRSARTAAPPTPSPSAAPPPLAPIQPPVVVAPARLATARRAAAPRAPSLPPPVVTASAPTPAPTLTTTAPPPTEDFVAAARRIDGVAAATATASATPIPTLPPAGIDAHPTYGQVVVGLASAMPRARACNAGAPIVARLTFANDGHVLRVDAPAADDSTRACLRGAFETASVPPFVEPTYVVPVTVRSR
jgi:hypothetical protein